VSPRLRPGLVVVRRDDRHLQVGLEPPRRVVLPDLPAVRRLLDDLREGRAPDVLQPAVADALARLERAGLLAPPPPAPERTSGRTSAQPSPPTTGPAIGPAGPQVALLGPRALIDAAAAQLRAAGIRPRADAEVRLLLAYGALRRDLADPLVREGVPHLAAVVTPWGWELGPFVVPGETACLRCVDAAYGDSDPRHGVVVDQIARNAVPVPLGPPSLAIALGWVARDLLAHARGERPTTWSATVRLAHLTEEEAFAQRRWLRHPHCGCAWDALTG
jgi:hypothetical protein